MEKELDISQIALVMHYNGRMRSELQSEHSIYVQKLLRITKRNSSQIIKILNGKVHRNDMRLNDVVDEIRQVYRGAKDAYTFTKAASYFIDAERYKTMGEERTYKYLKRKCIENFLKIEDPGLIQTFREEMGSYLPKKYRAEKKAIG